VTPIIKAIDYCDPLQIFLQLAQEPGVCFLDSSKNNDQLGRYSYIASHPFLVIRSKNETTNPFDDLNNALEHYKSEPIKDLPPFQGGAMGYFAYDLLHHLENIPRPALDDINIPDLLMGFYDLVIAFDHLKKQAWIISQGFPETEPAARHHHATARIEWLSNKLATTPAPAFKSSWKHTEIISNFTQAQYQQAVEKVIDYIYAGDVFQANISQRFSSVLPENITPAELYAVLRFKNPATFSAYLNFDEVCVASASPERFIHLQNNKVQTRPIKGTRPRGKSAEEDLRLAQELMNSEKDLAENTMIVDLMRNDLSRVCEPNSVHVTQLCGLESYETVHHLVSVIEAELQPNFNAISLLKATFPGGSITGAPKIRAMEIISEIEPSARSLYCGCIGYLGFDGNMDTSIAIRTYTIKNNRVYFQAGGGILADSDPETEYQESLIKAYALKKVLEGEDFCHDLAD
jgi:para-aminobenzoate synthetase component I